MGLAKKQFLISKSKKTKFEKRLDFIPKESVHVLSKNEATNEKPTMNTQMLESLQDLESGVFHYLTGYLKASSSRAREVLNYPHWQERALQELERRITRMLETFDDETIQALAEGAINMKGIAAKVLDKGANIED